MKNRLILADLVIIYARFGNSQPPVSLEIATIASLIFGHHTKKLLKKKEALFYADFCCHEGISCFFWNR